MREIEVRVVSLEEADHETAEFWLGGQLFGFTQLEEGELVLTIAPSDDAARSRLMPTASTTRSLRRNACSSLTDNRRDVAPSKATSPASSNRSRKLAGPNVTRPRLTIREELAMQAIAVGDRDTGLAGLSLTSLPNPHAAENDVIVRVHAAGFTPGELAWAGTWTDRAGRDRTPSVPGHEVSGVVTELGYGTTGLTVGQRVFGLADWTRNGTLADYVAIEARNLAPLPAGLDHAVAAGAVISGLTAWQALFDHAHLLAGQTVLIHGAAGGVGSIAVQLAREVGSRVIGTGRAADRDRALGLGVEEFVDLGSDRLEDAGQADVVLDLIGGDILTRSIELVRAGGTLVTTIEPPTATARERAGDLLRRGGQSLPTRRARPTAARRTTDFERGGCPALGRSASRVRPRRSARVREDDHPGHRRLVARPR